MATVGFLHTSPVHVSTFDDLVHQVAPTLDAVHAVDESLLELARAAGPEAVLDGVRERVDELRAQGASAVVCTCSTIGDVAERVAGDVHTLRVDRPMARRAVRLGARIGVVAAVESTLAPTNALLEQEAAAAGVRPTIELVVVDGAWAAFEAGDMSGYLQLIAAAARDLAERVDVIVLAQASMASAEERLHDVGVPVLSSPRAAVVHVADVLE